jgi:hypothetical protein
MVCSLHVAKTPSAFFGRIGLLSFMHVPLASASCRLSEPEILCKVARLHRKSKMGSSIA